MKLSNVTFGFRTNSAVSLSLDIRCNFTQMGFPRGFWIAEPDIGVDGRLSVEDGLAFR